MNAKSRIAAACLLVASIAAIPLFRTTPAVGESSETKPATSAIVVRETNEVVEIETDALAATIRKTDYVTGIAERSFLDKRTGARDVGYGLHIMDFLMAPGWRDDGYERDAKVHGDLPKHYVEGPQICTQVKRLPVEVIRGKDFVAVKMRYTYDKPGKGYKAGSTWEQTLVFRPGLRYVLSGETITSANDVENVFYRLDMPGHIKHGGQAGDTFAQVYLSYGGKPGNNGDDEGQFIPAAAFKEDFGPDQKFLYQRKDGAIPKRMIRAHQVKQNGKPGPWLAGMTLDPAIVSEAWCHQRGYISFIQELHGRKAKAGETIGAAYVIGWFDGVEEMRKVYDGMKGKTRVAIRGGTVLLE